MVLTVLETLVVSGTLFASRHVFGYVYSNEKEVVDYVTTMAPLICVSVILDSIQGVLSGLNLISYVWSFQKMNFIVVFLQKLLYNFIRYCKGMWMAAYRSLCQPRSILSMRNSGGCHPWFLVTFQRDRPVDRYTVRCFYSNSFADNRNKLHKLGETGS